MGLMSLRSALCVFGFSTSVPIATSRQRKCAIAQKFQSVWSIFENVSSFYLLCMLCFSPNRCPYCLCNARTHQDRLAPFRAAQWRTGDRNKPARRLLRSPLLKVFYNHQEHFFFCYSARSTITTNANKIKICICLNLDDRHSRGT